MSTPDFELHRAIVHWSDPTTGFAQVRVPTLLGAESVVYIPNTGLTQGDDGFWNVPPDGASVFIAVSSDRTQFLWLTAVDAAPVDEDTGADILAATGEPMGHEDRTESAMAFDDSTRIFTIQPVGDSFTLWCKGTRYVKTGTSSLTLPDTTDLYYIYFDPDGLIQYRTNYFVWDEDCPTSYVYWNSTTQKAEFFADERHGIVLDWQTHEYLHRTRGASIANGFDVDPTSFVIDGDGTADSHCYFTLENGTFFDEDLQVDVVSSATPTANSWEQDLSSPAQIPVFYLTANGWVMDDPTNFPFKMGASRPYFNDGTSLTQIDSNKFGIAWIVATNNLNYPVLAIMGQDQYGNIGEAEARVWSDLTLTDLPIVEMRPLYKYVFQTKDTYTNSVKAALRGIYDNRRVEASSIGAPIAAISDGSITTEKLADEAVTAAKIAAAVQDLLVPAGTVAATVKTTADTGWLMLDGSAVSSADTLYPSLWSAAPTSWKSGTTLNLPDMSNKTLGGSGTTALGAAGGSNSVTLAETNLPSHAHSISHGHSDTFSGSASSHTHSIDPPNTSVSLSLGNNTTQFVRRLGNYATYAVPVASTGMAVDYVDSHGHSISGSVNIGSFTSGGPSATGVSISGSVTNYTGNSGNTGSGTSVDVTNAHLAVNFQIKAH
jgi:microcystin-dependent protein